ncbi:RNA polymerase sigma-54 factor [Apibacter muscae]|uniref:RNA polymerase sigma-54 factor n=1 Tax=Apibacter muscae TaxID=2509004 RepID=A0A563D768_9FLAO|nr:RNA polymerase factor sigma-54 [Apibacter muscae]TWP23422.1 RNA polymerase sigma-54 factor [Apibacter muscae]TWP26056.1 RNA polymerase sigma-54 factor [Apibacter muscae]TWP27907.1 RNA polymerase sigma-54 factor [Apibacter muscae]
MLKQDLKLKQLLKLSPQQIQLMKLVQLPTLAFEEAVKQELEENPALEDISNEDYYDASESLEASNDYDESSDNEIIDAPDINIDEYLSDDEIPSYRTQSNNYSDEEDETEMPYAQYISFQEHLISQLHTFRLNEEEIEITDFIVGNLHDDGYLRRDLSAIVDDLAFTQGIYTDEETVEKLLVNYIQKLDPTGVGARDLQECLLLQLKAKNQTEFTELAYKIIDEAFDAFTKKHYSKLQQKFSITDDELKEAINEIEKLNPKPGKSFTNNSKNTEQIIPDFTIRIVDGKLELLLNGRNAPELKVSREYSEMLDTYKNTEKKSREQKDAVMFVKQKLDSAKWFIDAVKQRQQTLYITMKSIMDYQKNYFLSGDEEQIKPMILKDISEITGLDISTISRVANSKYVNTPYGTLLIKDLFSESLTNSEGDEVSTREIKTILQDVINNEDPKKPLTDDNLMKILNEKGYNIARRTIAKYRDQLNIPVARLRKKI